MHIHLCGLHDKDALAPIQEPTGRIYNAALKENQYTQVIHLLPTWELVGGHKKGKGNTDAWCQKYDVVTDEQYFEQYTALLDGRKYPIDQWLDERLFKYVFSHIALTCYCPSVRHRGGNPKWDFCHLDVLEAWLWNNYGRAYQVTRF